MRQESTVRRSALLIGAATVACSILLVACSSKARLPVGSDLGMQAPTFALPNADGETVTLADFTGGPVVLVFFRGNW